MSQHIFNLKRQLDHSDDPKLPRMMMAAHLPLIVDIRQKCPPVFDQGELGSCTANAGIGSRMVLTGVKTMLSRLYQYYQERKIEGTIKEDSGAQMKDICVALQTVGVCPEADWPYDIAKFAKAPNPKANKDAGQFKIKSYATFDGDTQDDIQQIKQYLATVGQPVLIGMDVYESFESETVARTGIVPVPNTAMEKLLGGHAVLIVGYDDSKQVLIVRNSWGDSWGDKGYFHMPYAFVEKHIAYDTWTISM